MDSLIERTKINHNSRTIENYKGGQGQLFKNVNRLLNKRNDFQISDEYTVHEFSDELNDYFVSKIETIRSEFDPVINNDCYAFDEVCFEVEFRTFRILEPREVRKMIMSAKKTRMLDPLPTFLVKECVDELLTPITNIINGSLRSSVMPYSLKHALVTPRLKKPTLPVEPKSFRTVSNQS